MSGIISIVLPVFGLVGLGYFAVRVKLMGTAVADGVSDYVFALAIPSLIFRTVYTGTFPDEVPWALWGAYFSGVAAVWVLAMLSARRLFGAGHQESVIQGLAAAQSNMVLMGIPLILAAYGEQGAVPLFLLIAIHMPLMLTAAALLIETADTSGGSRTKRLVKVMATHPILVALFAGMMARTLGVTLPDFLRTIIDMLAASASPAALVAMGAALVRYGARSQMRAAAVLTFLKLAVHPVIVWVLAVHVFDLPPVFAGVAVIFAALPTGINAYLLAARYGVGQAVTSSMVSLSTLVSIVTVTFWMWVMNVG